MNKIILFLGETKPDHLQVLSLNIVNIIPKECFLSVMKTTQQKFVLRETKGKDACGVCVANIEEKWGGGLWLGGGEGVQKRIYTIVRQSYKQTMNHIIT